MCIMRITEKEHNPNKTWAWVFQHSQPWGVGELHKGCPSRGWRAALHIPGFFMYLLETGGQLQNHVDQTRFLLQKQSVVARTLDILRSSVFILIQLISQSKTMKLIPRCCPCEGTRSKYNPFALMSRFQLERWIIRHGLTIAIQGTKASNSQLQCRGGYSVLITFFSLSQ